LQGEECEIVIRTVDLAGIKNVKAKVAVHAGATMWPTSASLGFGGPKTKHKQNPTPET
jgi:hypothetical protein